MALSWSTTGNPTSCTASGAWTGTKNTSGSELTSTIITSKTYTLTCTGPGGSASDSIIINTNIPTCSASFADTFVYAPNSLRDAEGHTRYSYSDLSWTSSNAQLVRASCTGPVPKEKSDQAPSMPYLPDAPNPYAFPFPYISQNQTETCTFWPVMNNIEGTPCYASIDVKCTFCSY